jgi:hypothetical protein
MHRSGLVAMTAMALWACGRSELIDTLGGVDTASSTSRGDSGAGSRVPENHRASEAQCAQPNDGQCSDDSACPSGQACACNGSAYTYGTANTCVAGDCRVDSDCGSGGYCSPSFDTSSCSGVAGYYCHTPEDQCVNDADCGSPQVDAYCVFSYDDGFWKCQSGGSCG